MAYYTKAVNSGCEEMVKHARMLINKLITGKCEPYQAVENMRAMANVHGNCADHNGYGWLQAANILESKLVRAQKARDRQAELGVDWKPKRK